MNRLHIHVSVKNLEDSLDFYTTLFGTKPTVRKSDYIKWRLEDPRINFVISARGRPVGVDHFGIEVDTREDLASVSDRLKSAAELSVDLGKITCCYTETEKTWGVDPQGLTWEAFFTSGSATVYGEDPELYDRLQEAAALRHMAPCGPEADTERRAAPNSS